MQVCKQKEVRVDFLCCFISNGVKVHWRTVVVLREKRRFAKRAKADVQRAEGT